MKLELSHKERAAKEHEILQQHIFLRGRDALPGKLREDFEKMLAAHREQLEKNLRIERDEVENEREKRLVVERETMEKQLKVEQERMNLELERERSEMRQTTREKEGKLREEVREEMERIRTALETEKELLREQVRAELVKERNEIRAKFLKEKEGRDAEIRRQLKKTSQEEQLRNERRHGGMTNLHGRKSQTDNDSRIHKDIRIQATKAEERQQGEEGLGQNHVRFEAEEAERRRNCLGRDEYEVWLAGQRMEHTKQWVQRQYRFNGDSLGYMDDSAGGNDDLERDSNVRYWDEDGSGNDDRVVSNDRSGQDYGGYMHDKERQHRLREDSCGYFEANLSRKDGNMDSNKQVGGHGWFKEDHDRISPIVENKDEEQENRMYPYEIKNIPSQRNPENTQKNPDRNTEYSITSLKEENEGLKAKLTALQENIELHECFKKEASEEVERLRKSNKNLKMKLEELENTMTKHEELENTMKSYEGMKGTLMDYEKQLKDFEGQLKDDKEKIKDYEDICAEYERTLQKCREKIMIMENDHQTSTLLRNMTGNMPKSQENVSKIPKEARRKIPEMLDEHNCEYIGSANKPEEMVSIVKYQWCLIVKLVINSWKNTINNSN